MYPPCIPDQAPSDYYQLLFMANNLADEELALREAYENRLFHFLCANNVIMVSLGET